MLSLLLPLALFMAQADDKVFSGPQPGEKITPFKVLGHAGVNAGKEVQLLGDSKGEPTLLIFVHELTRPGFQLMRPLDLYGSKLVKNGFRTHFIWLTADRTKTEELLTRAKQALSLKSPMSISLDGLEGPGSYGLNRKMTFTILVAKENKVVANFAIVQPNETDAPKILEAMAKLVGQKAPTLEALRAELGTGPKTDVAAKPANNPELQQLMRRMIQKTNEEDTVREIAREMVKWAGEDAKKKTELKAYCKKIAELGYGTEAAKKALKRLAGE